MLLQINLCVVIDSVDISKIRIQDSTIDSWRNFISQSRAKLKVLSFIKEISLSFQRHQHRYNLSH